MRLRKEMEVDPGRERGNSSIDSWFKSFRIDLRWQLLPIWAAAKHSLTQLFVLCVHRRNTKDHLDNLHRQAMYKEIWVYAAPKRTTSAMLVTTKRHKFRPYLWWKKYPRKAERSQRSFQKMHSSANDHWTSTPLLRNLQSSWNTWRRKSKTA